MAPVGNHCTSEACRMEIYSLFSTNVKAWIELYNARENWWYLVFLINWQGHSSCQRWNYWGYCQWSCCLLVLCLLLFCGEKRSRTIISSMYQVCVSEININRSLKCIGAWHFSYSLLLQLKKIKMFTRITEVVLFAWTASCHRYM